MNEYWKTKLTPFDIELCKMVENLTKTQCEPKNGGTHYFIQADYGKKQDPDFVAALWDAISGRVGTTRLISIKDDPDITSLIVRIRFADSVSPESGFIPKHEE